MGGMSKKASRKANKRRNEKSEAAGAEQQTEEFLESITLASKAKASFGADRRPNLPTLAADQSALFDDDSDYEQDLDDEILVDETAGLDLDDNDEEQQAEAVRKTVWNPKVHGALKEGEELQFDSSAYALYHSLRVEWPCLSFDLIRDKLGQCRTRFPYTLTVAAGTQADNPRDNKVCLWKVSNLQKTRNDDASDDDDDDSDSDSDDEEEKGLQPVIVDKEFAHPGAVNRLRSCPQRPGLLATWSDLGAVYLWDAQTYIDSLDKSPRIPLATSPKPLHQFDGHTTEGYALDWSSVVVGRLASGDCNRGIHVWEPTESSWLVSKESYRGHAASVEDIQWSPTEQGVFASCSVDKSIRIWDTRTRAKSMLSVDGAHADDINVISWNSCVGHLLASGCDDGSFKVWDLRVVKSGQAAGFFQWHDQAITSIEWHPTQDSILCVSSEDDSCTVWDMSVELDREEAGQDGSSGGADLAGLDVPAQLAFVHRGQSQIKEVHWHPQIPSMIATTSLDGFNFFKPDNLECV